ncbi:mitochondrial ribosomal protein S9 [Suhomyces tanzawaensis NRRL Y-17324]|uniref:Small ribosomal subunit protein uS9m n=1 Tax=Suhomyces tanzawaensis NRRL Y-17324 TaxID=984487 RepID=A0A1E4SFH4_9ASCO|nr:mitochondrial ribosomal protein S9 [Suhomyces tanzawaensis NRRL Y-17324]ODV78264.1 mitochondrial ribosomal protein S9 [Suhomyces tanzawaensis NRRL Y-17324]
MALRHSVNRVGLIPRRAFSTAATRLQEQGRPLVPPTLKERIKNAKITIRRDVTLGGLYHAEAERLRVIPKLKTFFGGIPVHEENMNELNAIIRKYINLPTRLLTDEELRATKFISFETYKEMTQSGTRFKALHFKELTQALHRLRSIDSQLMPKEVSEVLEKYRNNSGDSLTLTQKEKTLDEFGRAFGKAKRKASSAEVQVVRGEGEILVNGRSVTDYFPRDSDRQKLAYPFKVIGQEGGYNIFATVSGGGVSGQVEAVMYAVAKALIVFNPLLKPRLKKAGLMTSDSRIVERKKPGKVKARKSPTWVKR